MLVVSNRAASNEAGAGRCLGPVCQWPTAKYDVAHGAAYDRTSMVTDHVAASKFLRIHEPRSL